MVINSADLTASIEQQCRACEVVAVMKQRLQHLEKSIALTVMPLDHKVSSPESGAPGLTNGKEVMRPTVSSCATAVKAVQQVIGKPAGVESKPGRSGTSCNAGSFDDLSLSDPVNADGFTSIFVGGIPMAVTDDQLRVMLGTKAQIGRYHRKAKVGYAKILVSNLDVVRVLELELTVSGQKLRVARWRSKAPSHRVPAVAYATNRRNGHHIKSEVAMKEQARFVAEFLHARAGPPGGRRLYSQVASNTAEARMKSMETAIYGNTAEARMKSMETAIYGVRQLLERLTKHRQ